MAESIGDLSLILRGSAEGLAADLSRDLKAAESSIQAKAVAMGTLIADGIKAGISGIANLIKGAVNLGFEGLDRIDSLDEAAGKVGLTYNAFQDLKFAAESAGGSVEALSSSLVKMQAGIASGDAESPLGMLKLDLDAIRKMEPDKQFAEIVEQLSKVGSTADKIDLTRQIFGKGGVELMNVINNGKDGLAEVSRIVEGLGGHLTEADVAVVGMANDNLDKLKYGWGFIKDQIAVGIAPVLTMITRELLKQSSLVGGIGKLTREGVDAMVDYVAKAADAVQYATALASAIKTGFDVVFEIGRTLVSGFKLAWQAFQVLARSVSIAIRSIIAQTGEWIYGLINTIKNTTLGLINDIVGETIKAGVNIARKLPKSIRDRVPVLNDASLSGFESGVDDLKARSNMIPDLPTDGAPGSPSSALFPNGEEKADFTGVKKGWEDLKTTVKSANSELEKSSKETAKKLADIYVGNSLGDRIKAQYELEKKALATKVKDNSDAARNILDIDRELAAGRKETQDWFEKATLESFQKIGKQLYEWQQANERTMEQFRSLNRDVVGDLVTSWATGTGKISDIISQWSNNMIRQFIQLSLFGNKGANGTGGTITGLVGSLFGGLGSTASTTSAATSAGGGWASAIGSIFGGAFAEGGRPPMGKISVIGEHGAELWKPDSAGTIIPNHEAAAFLGGGVGAGGGSLNVQPPVVVHFTNHFQTGLTQADLAGAMDQMQDAAMAGVYEGVRRGGGYRKGMQA